MVASALAGQEGATAHLQLWVPDSEGLLCADVHDQVTLRAESGTCFDVCGMLKKKHPSSM